MQKVIITKGLPGSGKSTWAKSVVSSAIPNKYKRISKDDLRLMMDNSLWSKANEKFVLKVRDYIILEALKDNKIPIVDDTNLNPLHENHIRELVKGIAEVEIQDFTDVSIEKCIENDLKRPNSVGQKIIYQMYNQWLKPKPIEFKKQIFDPLLSQIMIVDCDGTLALFGEKNPYSRDFINDTLNVPIANLINNKNVILVSGREDKYRDETELWLYNNMITYITLYMRKTGYSRKDYVIKQEIYDNYIKGKYNVTYVIDDRLQTCRMWYQNGLTVLRVGDPDANF
jgi:predicted kinase